MIFFVASRVQLVGVHRHFLPPRIHRSNLAPFRSVPANHSLIFFPSRTYAFVPSTANKSNTISRPLSSLASTNFLHYSGGKKSKSVPFILADIGEGISEVELLQWYVAPGDRVAQFDRVCEVQSDKATVEITSRFDGVVDSVNGAVGDMISVGSPLMHIAVESDEVNEDVFGTDSSSDNAKTVKSQSITLNNVNDEEDRLCIPSVPLQFPSFPVGNDETTGGTSFFSKADGDRIHAAKMVFATPAVRRIGIENGLDLSTVIGTGPKGRVLKADVLKLIQPREETNLSDSETDNLSSSSLQLEKICTTLKKDTIVPIRGYNRLMVNSMTASLQIPHMCYSDEVNMTELKSCREKLKTVAQARGVKLTFMPFAIKAASLAMREFPAINSSIDVKEYTLTYHGDHNIGVAIDSPRGLVVPVIQHCQDLSIFDIAKELNRLHNLALQGSLSEKDVIAPTFTLSNIGAIGGTYMSPIIPPPQVAIGAMGKIQRLPRFIGDNTDQVEAVHMMNISWGADHRVIDGATLGRFSNLWKSFMEMPALMTIDMK